ncbi:hypothetical protein BH23VER1_BH23VER1_15730 [soil metagenome]
MDETDETARQILDTMLGYLGFVVEIRPDEAIGGHALQVYTSEAAFLTGRRGDRLDDIQYLVNRLLQERLPDAPRVRVDVEHYRSMREDGLIEGIRSIVERVKATGKAAKLSPMNAYHRRLVHETFKGDPSVETWSPPGSGRLKRITIRRRHAVPPAPPA